MLDLYRYDFLKIPNYCNDTIKSCLPKKGTFEVDGYYYTCTPKDSILEEVLLADSFDTYQITEFEFYQSIPKNLNIEVFGKMGLLQLKLSDMQRGFYDFVDKTIHVFWYDYSVYFTFELGKVTINYRKWTFDINRDTAVSVNHECIVVILKAIRLFNVGIYKIVEV